MNPPLMHMHVVIFFETKSQTMELRCIKTYTLHLSLTRRYNPIILTVIFFPEQQIYPLYILHNMSNKVD